MPRPRLVLTCVVVVVHSASNKTFIAPVTPVTSAAASTAASAASLPGTSSGSAAPQIPAESVTALLCSTRALLFVNADNYTAWNARKKLLLLQHLTARDELRLLDLIFSKHPKSAESWAHRYAAHYQSCPVSQHVVLAPFHSCFCVCGCA